jgi:hypothetical protein
MFEIIALIKEKVLWHTLCFFEYQEGQVTQSAID